MNPWLTVPAGEYEAHMASPEVGQLPVLAELLRADLARYRPSTLAVLGCATGNGFEHIDPGVTTRVVGIDINPEYIGIARERHAQRLPRLQLIHGDVVSADFPACSFDLVHAALVFEYVDAARVLPRVARWLRPGGVLTVVLQGPSASAPPVTPTPWRSLEALSPILRLVDPLAFGRIAAASGLVPRDAARVGLPAGKSFHAAHYVRAVAAPAAALPTEES